MGFLDWVPFIGSGLNFLGGLIGSNQQADAMREATAANREAAWNANQMQREFAQHGIRWRMADAEAAGIHPLAALGAQVTPASPVVIGETADPSAGDGWRAFGQMGQDVSRAISATKTQSERELEQLQVAMAHTQLEGASLDNQVKLAQLKKLSSTGPAMPTSLSGVDAANFIPGQGNGPLVKVKPSERTASQPGRLAQEAGWRPDVSYARTDTGLTPMVPEGLSESLEDDIIGKAMWRIRNQLIPNLTGQGAPAASQLPKGATGWKWSHTRQEWQPDYSKPSKMDNYMDSFRANLRKKYPGSKVR